jgi:FKBP-type peptidyl-prolyl cis-trans isomerase (trigger factor)
MKVEVKKLENGKKELSIAVTGDVVKAKFESVFQEITKEAKLPGFRQGHAPRDMIEKNFSAQAHEQVLKELVPELYTQAVDQEKVEVLELPEITDVKLDRASLSFKATVDIYPEIKLKEYKKVPVSYRVSEVTPDEVKKQLDALKESRKIEALDDSVAKSLGYPNMSELEKALQAQILLNKDHAARQKREDAVVDFLLDQVDIRLPQSMVARQQQEMLRQTKINLAMKGVPREQIDAQEKKIAQDIEPQARKQVKLYLVFSEIAKKESIANDDHMPQKVMELVLREAEWKLEK